MHLIQNGEGSTRKLPNVATAMDEAVVVSLLYLLYLLLLTYFTCAPVLKETSVAGAE